MAAYLVPDIFGQSAGAYNIDDQGLRYLLSTYVLTKCTVHYFIW